MKKETKMITDRLGKELAVGDKVAYESFKTGLGYGEVVKLNRKRVVIKSIGVAFEGMSDYLEYGFTEVVSGYDIIKAA
jgi:hypothetical protein